MLFRSIQVYNGLGKLTADTISVAEESTGDLIPDDSSETLIGKYALVYDGTVYNNDYDYFTNKQDLWNVIKSIATTNNGVFVEDNAKLVRYVNYNIQPIGKSFTSFDLAKGVTDNEGINYLNERKTAASIWEIRCYGYYKFVSGDSVDTGLNEYLQTHDSVYVALKNKGRIYLTGTNPSTWQTNEIGRAHV